MNKQTQVADKGWSSSWGWSGELTTSHRKKSYKILHTPFELDGFFGTTYTTENGYDIWNMECQESL